MIIDIHDDYTYKVWIDTEHKRIILEWNLAEKLNMQVVARRVED